MTKAPDEYRIRWANVSVCNGYTCRRERRCIAERAVRIFGTVVFWAPVGDWRHHPSHCGPDIAHDRDIRAPMPNPVYFGASE